MTLLRRSGRYDDDMMFGVVRAPSRRLSRPHVRRKFLLEQLQSETPDATTQARLQQALANVERELRRCLHVRWTMRDTAILNIVAALKHASTEQVQRVIAADLELAALGTSLRGISNRMRLMYAHGWLDRPPLQRALLYEHNAPLIYTIGPAGARILAEAGAGKVDWAAKRSAVPLTLAHELEVNDAVLTFQAAFRDAGLTFLDQDRLTVPELSDRRLRVPHPFGCKVDVDVPGRDQPLPLTAIPDRAFAVRYADGSGHTFLLEWDRSSMPVGNRRTRLQGKSSFIKKLFAYHAIWRQKLHETRWGVTRWRLLTVTTSEKRIAGMLEAQQLVTGGRVPGLFLYTTTERIEKDGVLAPIWISAKRNGVGLLDQED